MLAKTLDETMAKASKLENITMVSKFSSVYKSQQNNIEEKEVLMLQKLADYTAPRKNNSEKDEFADYIVEKPEQKAQIIDFKKSAKTGLPFFRSIEYKLEKGV